VTYPVFIVCRDRLTYLTQLLDWLESVGNADEVYLIDNDSTYPPLLAFYATTRHTVIRTGGNHGHKVGWKQGVLRRYAAGRRFIYTDPDILPVEDCPDDALARMAEVLDSTSDIYKCGFSLKIDDLPDWCREGIVAWESRYWRPIDEWVNAYKAPIDTTFALHNPHAVRGFRYQPAYRLPPPYTARHLPWYTDPARLSDEDEFYRVHADTSVSNWARYVLESQT
jgi:hypothetical protein